MRQQYVYFAQRECGGFVKIGLSCKPQERMYKLWAPDASRQGCRLLATVPLRPVRSRCEAREEEARFHRRFADVRYVGEWFEPSPDLMAFIGEVAV